MGFVFPVLPYTTPFLIERERVEDSQDKFSLLHILAPGEGFEPPTKWLTATRSAS
jgi:hypothetical protein